MTEADKKEILLSLELRLFIIATKLYPTEIDMHNQTQLTIILKQLEELWK